MKSLSIRPRPLTPLKARHSDPLQHLIYVAHGWPCCNEGPVDQDDGQTPLARRRQLGLRPRATRVFGHYMGDAVRLQQGAVALHGERPPVQHHLAALGGQIQNRIDQAQQVPVLRASQKRRQMLAANGQKHPGGLGGQSLHRGGYIWHVLPHITALGLPSRPLQRQQGHTRTRTGLYGVAAHLGGKGVGGIHHMGDALSLQKGLQSSHAAKAAHAGGQRLGYWSAGAACVRKNTVHTRLCQGLRQTAGIQRAPQHQHTQGGAHHV